MMGNKSRMQGKVMPEQNASTVYVGIDVCKTRLDVYLHPVGRKLQVSNCPQGLKQLRRELRAFTVVRIVMEATGKFHRVAHRTLTANGFEVAIVNPLRSRRFAQALGELAKTDSIDARLLAILGETLAPKSVPPRSQALEELQELVHARNAATAEAAALSNRCGTAHTTFLRTELRRRQKITANHIARIEAEIRRRIETNEALARKYEILRSIPGIGLVAAITLLVDLTELGHCSAKAASLLAGVAPLADDSGQRVGERYIQGGRFHVRTALYMAAVTASRINPHLAAFYKRLRAAGKKPKVALTAVMRKLVVLANTLITQNRSWLPTAP
jgi:transposase